jgi:SpoVK/Ycf46/Vps4 family AAA+-type ATPase
LTRRFDELFFVDLPTLTERKAIWQVHINKKNRKGFDIDNLAAKSDGYSGAEIEAAFIDGMFEAFSQGAEVTDSYVLEALKASVPLSKMAAERIDTMRTWAKGRAKLASAVESTGQDSRFGALDL